MEAVNLDLELWYAAYNGNVWDGTLQSMSHSRRLCSTRSNNIDRNVIRVDRRCINSYRSCHLLMEPLGTLNADRLTECQDYTTYIGWPSELDVGHLQWDNSHGRACCYCGALMLESELVDAKGAPGMKCGTSCCDQGQVFPPEMPEWPAWLVSLWMGPSGREFGSDGLLRTCLRKYSRQIHNALSLSSQVGATTQVRHVNQNNVRIQRMCMLYM